MHDATATNDREGIEDAMYRFLEGIDKRDADLLASAFTEDIIFDLGGLDASVGSFPPYEGRDYACIHDMMNDPSKQYVLWLSPEPSSVSAGVRNCICLDRKELSDDARSPGDQAEKMLFGAGMPGTFTRPGVLG